MKRITTDDEKSTLSHLNMFYAKNGEVWVRGGGQYPDYQDVTLVQWIRAAAQKHRLNLTAEDPENLGDEMYDALQDGDETIEGIMALLHAAAVQATEMRERLKSIEDIMGDTYDLDRLRELVEADRGGRCAVLPCKPGDTVWLTVRRGIYCVERWSVYQIYRRDGGGWYFRLKNMMLSQKRPNEFEECTRAISAFGKTMFLDREAAEQALKEWKDG